MAEQHLETFKATGVGNGWPTKINITNTGFTFQLDEPVEDGGTNTGANPMQCFAASLIGCQNEQAQVVAEELGIKIAQINIDLEIDLDLSGFMGMKDQSDDGYKCARMKTTVSGDFSADQLVELGKRVDARCPILGLLRNSDCRIESTWTHA